MVSTSSTRSQKRKTNSKYNMYGITNLNATKLNLNNKGLTQIPDFVFSMKNLKYLILTRNDLTSLPAEIAQLRNLKHLYLNSNKLTSLPTEIGRLTNLTILNLDDNRLMYLPESIGNLKNLTVLSLNKNRLTSLPESIGKLRNLRTLTLGRVRLTSSLPQSFENLSDKLEVNSGTKQNFMKKYRRVINKNTELFNAGVYLTNDIPRFKRYYIDKPSNVKTNGTLRRVYNVNGLAQLFKIKKKTKLHGDFFTINNIKRINNKNFNLQRIRVRLLNTPLINMRATIEGVKNKLPPNVSRTDVNNMVRRLKPLMLNKIRNRLRTTPTNQRQALLNKFKRDGLINKNNNLTV